MKIWLLLLALSQALGKIHLSNITPFRGPLTGNTRVRVRGTNLAVNEEFLHPVCKFGSSGSIVKASYVKCTPEPVKPGEPDPETADKTADCLECDPNLGAAAPGIVHFKVSLTGDFKDLAKSLDFEFYHPAEIHKIVPRYGPKNGGIKVTVYGKHFKDYGEYLRCSFGTLEGVAQFYSDTLIYCLTPFSEVTAAAMPVRITMNDQQQNKDDIKYWYYPEPAIAKLEPNKGSTAGGNNVTIIGEDLDPFNDMLDEVNNHADYFCKFGDLYGPVLEVISDTKVVCKAPPSPMVRTVPVDLTLNDADIVVNPGSWTDDHKPYTYYAPPVVFDITPKVGPVSGNTTIVIHGSNFNNTGKIKCKFGTHVVKATYKSVNEIECKAPSTLAPGPVEFSVSLEDDNYGPPTTYVYYAKPVIKTVSPMCGPTSGYTQITITGQNFVFLGHDLVYCIFDDIYTPATVMSTTELKCDSPDISRTSKTLDKHISSTVAITLNKKDITKHSSNFTYYFFHHLDSMVPASGPITGHTHAILYGGDFAQWGVCNVTVRFGTTEVLSLSHNTTTIKADSPAVAVPGHAIVQVSLNGQQFTDYSGPSNIGGSKADEGALEFEYYQPPLVTHFSPKEGPSTGNSTVIIDGTGFITGNNSDIELKFSKADGKLLGMGKCYRKTLNQLECLTPEMPANTHAVLSLSKNGVDFAPITGDTYLTYKAPTITSISPQYGPVGTGPESELTVTGTNFQCVESTCSALTCRFGTSPYPIYKKATHISSTSIKCPIPRLKRPEVVDVEISPNGYDYTHNTKNYTYYDEFILDVFPKFGKIDGGTPIHVMGFGFANTGTDLLCRFGSTEHPLLCKNKVCEVKATYVSDTEIICKTFPQADVNYQDGSGNVGYEPFNIEVSVRDRDFTNSNVQFTYLDEPKYSALEPLGGSANGGTYLVIQTDYKWKSENNTTGPDKKFVKKHSNVKCRFKGSSGTVFTEGTISTYPLKTGNEPNTVSCLSPPWSKSEQVVLDVSINGADYSGKFTYTFNEKLQENLISPKCGVNTGGTPVTIQGTGFNSIADLLVKWGTMSTSANIKTLFSGGTSTLTTHSPHTTTNNTHGGFVHIELGKNRELQKTMTENYTFYGDYTKDKLLYMYYIVPVVHDIFPSGGPNSGGTVVTLAGAWFLNYPAMNCTPICRFGDKTVPGTFISTVRVSCVAPAQPGLVSKVPLDISFNGFDWTDGTQQFVYYSTPKIFSLSPLLGPSSGGTMVGMSGVNFTKDARKEDFLCRFHSKTLNVPDKITPAFYKNSTWIYCVSPGGWGSGTEVSIDVTFNGIDYTNSNSSFYLFQIDNVGPLAGPFEGSKSGITIHGSGFLGNHGAGCVINNKEYKPISTTRGSIVCPMPPSTGPDFSAVPIEVTANGVDYQRIQGGLAYYKQPKVTSVEPNTGPMTGGSKVIIHGGPFNDHFQQANVTCEIGGAVGVGRVKSNDTIECTTPEMGISATKAGLPIKISLNGQDYTVNNHTFFAYGLLDMVPKSGPIGGGTEIYVRGFGFKANGRCRFGIDSNYLIVNATVIDDTRMVCAAPSNFKIPKFAALPLDVPFEIAFSAVKYHPWTRTENKFRFYQNPKILSMSPASGWVDELTTITMKADSKQGFFPAITGWKNSGELDTQHAIVCNFGKYGTVPAQYINHTVIKCVTPDAGLRRKDLHSDTVKVQVALNGQDFFPVDDYTFKGNASGLWIVLMWLLMVILFVAIILLLGLCCYYMWYEKSMSVPDSNEMLKFVQEHVLRQDPHVRRGEDGVIRPQNEAYGSLRDS